MELGASTLYADKTWVDTTLSLSGAQKKSLLVAAKGYCDALAVDGVQCDIDKISSASLLQWGGNKGLLIRADFAHFELQGILTLNQYGAACVVSTFKHCVGDEIFALNHSAEARKRAVIDRLQDLERIDYFFLIDHVIDQVSAFLLAAVKQLSQPECVGN